MVTFYQTTIARTASGLSGTTYFDHADWLGTERVRSDMSAVSYETCTNLAFGDGLSCSGGDPSPMHFTGKQHDTESGLDYFGARYDSSALGRFMSPDPITATPVHVVNPQRWNMYAYVANNPLTYLDPDGKDAIAVNFVSEVPLGGHEGIIVVHTDGSATYARFGPAHAASPVDKGKVDVQPLNPVKFGANGLPTDASYKELSEEVGKIEGEPAVSIGFNYFKTSEADSVALDNWMQNWKTTHAPDYNVTSSNCAAFCIAGLLVGHAIDNANISLVPNRLFMLLWGRADENWTWEGRRPNPEAGAKRHTTFPCLRRRDGTCVDQ